MSASQRAWRDGAQIELMRVAAADGGLPLRVPLIVQSRVRRDGIKVYRWKEKHDRNGGDASAEFTSREECLADGRRHASLVTSVR